MKKTQWLAMGVLLSMAGVASAGQAYGVITGSNIVLESSTNLGSTPVLVLKNGSEETCLAGPDGGLDLGDVNSTQTKTLLSLILAARSTGSDVAVGFEDTTCVVHTVVIGSPSAS